MQEETVKKQTEEQQELMRRIECAADRRQYELNLPRFRQVQMYWLFCVEVGTRMKRFVKSVSQYRQCILKRSLAKEAVQVLSEKFYPICRARRLRCRQKLALMLARYVCKLFVFIILFITLIIIILEEEKAQIILYWSICLSNIMVCPSYLILLVSSSERLICYTRKTKDKRSRRWVKHNG